MLAEWRRAVATLMASGDRDASDWIQKFNRSDEAWDVLLHVVSGRAVFSPQELIYAAQGLFYKCGRGPLSRDRVPVIVAPASAFAEKGAQAAHEIRDLIIAAATAYAALPQLKAVLRQIVLALAAIAARWAGVQSLKDAMVYCIQAWSVSSGDLIAGRLAALEFCAALPDTATMSKKVGISPAQRQEHAATLTSSFEAVHGLLTDTIIETPAITETAIRCAQAFAEEHLIPSGLLANSPLLAFSTTHMLATRSLAAKEFLAAAVHLCAASAEAADNGGLFASVTEQFKTLAQAPRSNSGNGKGGNDHNGNNNNNSDDDDDDDEALLDLLIVDLFAEAGHAFMDFFLSPVPAIAERLLPVIDVMLRATTHRTSNVVAGALKFWPGLAAKCAAHEKPPFHLLNAIRQAMKGIAAAARFAPNFAQLDAATREDFFEFFRNDVRDALRYIVRSLPPMTEPLVVDLCTVAMAELSQNRVAQKWKELEAALHAISAVSREVRPDMECLRQLLIAVLSAETAAASSPPGLRCTCCIIVGQLADFIRQACPQLMLPSIELLVASLHLPMNADLYPMKIGQDHVATVAFRKLVKRGELQLAGDAFDRLATDVWHGILLKDACVEELQHVLSDSSRLCFLEGLCLAASNVDGSAGKVQKLLEPLTPVLMADTQVTDLFDFAVQALATVLLCYQPRENPALIVAAHQAYLPVVKKVIVSTAATDAGKERLCRALTAAVKFHPNDTLLEIIAEILLFATTGRSVDGYHIEVVRSMLSQQTAPSPVLPKLVQGIIRNVLEFLRQGVPFDDVPEMVTEFFKLLQSCVADERLAGCIITASADGPPCIGAVAEECTLAGLRVKSRHAGIATLKFVGELARRVPALDPQEFARILRSIFIGLASGAMPSYMLEASVDCMIMMRAHLQHFPQVLTVAISEDGFPTGKTKATTKAKFVHSLVQAPNKSKFKRLVKHFAGGKKHGEVGKNFTQRKPRMGFKANV
eukprot:g3086.t1